MAIIHSPAKSDTLVRLHYELIDGILLLQGTHYGDEADVGESNLEAMSIEQSVFHSYEQRCHIKSAFDVIDTVQNLGGGLPTRFYAKTLEYTDLVPGTDDSADRDYVDDALGANAQVDYWGGNAPRLESIKKQYDPDNVFWNPQIIRARNGMLKEKDVALAGVDPSWMAS
ncbi:Glucooligosaccharide oxidase [Lecanosticta acicola]|uniref:Glucooligosaccharide oxidase n=1 Tax=Lecanosticta acicola TaxID=111012 RepID=A0AAI8YRC3_9PEZI|nr:Glucooligosaccharide oxidase [Lecanosticta acicola]